MDKKQQLITKFLKKNNNETSTNSKIINNETSTNSKIINNDITQNKKIINTEIIDNYNIDDNEEQFINRCVLCNIDIGFYNPRQYCKKTYCGNIYDILKF